MTKVFSLRRDERGAATVEMAFALPALALMLWGIFQVGVAFQANAGMQHALGQGARLATICVNPTTKGVCSRATDAEIKTKINDSVFGTKIGTFTVADPAPVPDGLELKVTFTMPMNFLFFNGPNVSIERKKTVYLA